MNGHRGDLIIMAGCVRGRGFPVAAMVAAAIEDEQIPKTNMRPPIRKYMRATIYFREGGFSEGFEVCIYSGFVIYFDEKGHERTVNIHLINEIVHYKAEDNPDTASV